MESPPFLSSRDDDDAAQHQQWPRPPPNPPPHRFFAERQQQQEREQHEQPPPQWAPPPPPLSSSSSSSSSGLSSPSPLFRSLLRVKTSSSDDAFEEVSISSETGTEFLAQVDSHGSGSEVKKKWKKKKESLVDFPFCFPPTSLDPLSPRPRKKKTPFLSLSLPDSRHPHAHLPRRPFPRALLRGLREGARCPGEAAGDRSAAPRIREGVGLSARELLPPMQQQ